MSVPTQARSAQTKQFSSKIQGLLLNADSMFRDSEKGTLDLVGHVQLVFNGQHIQCEEAHLDLQKKMLEAKGNVLYTTTLSTIGAEKISINYETNLGIIHHGYVESGPVIFQGDLINKTGDNEFLALEADYTACNTCPPAWSFSGKSIKAQLGGYASIRNAFLKFGGIPVLWLPYLIVPLKSDRQSGLLIPTLDFSATGGLAIAQTFFWAISRSQDASLTFKNYELRGPKGLLNYRYVLSDKSYGEMDAGFIKDRVFAKDPRLNKFRNPLSQGSDYKRWFLKYSHYYEMPDEFIQRTQLNFASDLHYPQDFPNETKNHGDSAMENRVSLTKNTENQHFLFDTSYFVNMLQSNPLADNRSAVHRLPEIHYFQTPQPLADTDYLYSLDFNYTNFTRSGNAYDDITEITNADGTKSRFVSNNKNSPFCEKEADCVFTNDGKYNPDIDLIRTGQRFDFKPTLYRPFHIGKLIDVMPKLSYRETDYQFSVGSNSLNMRRYLRTEIRARTTLSHVYAPTAEESALSSKQSFQSRYKHEIQPELTATAIPWIDHQAHPFFRNKSQIPFYSRENISDADLVGAYGMQYDYNDRIYDRSLVTLSLVSKLTEKRWVSSLPSYRQIAIFKLAQSYDAYQASQKKVPWSDISALLELRLDHLQSYTILNYFPYKKVTNSSSRIRINDDSGRFFQVALVRNFTISPTEPVNYNTRTEDYTFSSGVNSKYINFLGQVVYDGNWTHSKNEKKIKSWAYVAQLKPPGDCWSLYFIHDQVTGGDTNFRFNFDFIFDGRSSTSLNQSMLENYGF